MYPGCITGWLNTLSAEGRAALNTGMFALGIATWKYRFFLITLLLFCHPWGPCVDFMAHSLTKEVLLSNNSAVLLAKWHLGLIKWGCFTWELWTMQGMVDSLLWLSSQCSLCWLWCYVYCLTESSLLEEGAVHCAQHLASGRDLLPCVNIPALSFISGINSSAVGVYAVILWSIYM